MNNNGKDPSPKQGAAKEAIVIPIKLSIASLVKNIKEEFKKMKKFIVNENAHERAVELIDEHKGIVIPPLNELQDCDLIMAYGTLLSLADRLDIEADTEPFIDEFKRRSVVYGRELFVREGLARYEEV